MVRQQFNGNRQLDGKDSNGEHNGNNSMAMDRAMDSATVTQWQWTQR
jgi:hypothetical protein